MLSQFVFAMKMRIKQAFSLSVHMRFLLLLSSPQDTHVIIYQMCRPSQTPPDCVFRTNQSSIGTEVLSKTCCDADFCSME